VLSSPPLRKVERVGERNNSFPLPNPPHCMGREPPPQIANSLLVHHLNSSSLVNIKSCKTFVLSGLPLHVWRGPGELQFIPLPNPPHEMGRGPPPQTGNSLRGHLSNSSSFRNTQSFKNSCAFMSPSPQSGEGRGEVVFEPGRGAL